MPLTPGFMTVRDLFEKLKRDAAALESEVTSDGFFNFAVTGYTMIDWIKNRADVPASAKADLDWLYRELRVCGDIANAYKHFKLTRRVPVVRGATSSVGFGIGRFGKGGFGVGEAEIMIELENGTQMNALAFTADVLNIWEQFLSRHGM